MYSAIGQNIVRIIKIKVNYLVYYYHH